MFHIKLELTYPIEFEIPYTKKIYWPTKYSQCQGLHKWVVSSYRYRL